MAGKFLITPADKFLAETDLLISPPYKAHFRSVGFKDIGNTGTPHRYLVKNLLVEGEKSVMGGESQSGKSFAGIDIGMSVARGCDFMGFKVRQPRGVIYIASESAGGVVNLRVPAYKKHYELDSVNDLPIRFITQSPNLYDGNKDSKGIVADALHYAQGFSAPLGLIVLDTFSASTPGADENKSADVSRILANLDYIRETTGAHVMIIHHMNAGGEKLRGHTSIFANFDTVMYVAQTEERDRPEGSGHGRPVRTLTLAKRKDGVQGSLMKFVLKVIDLGKDEDDDPITSCICTKPENMDGVDLTTKWKEPGMVMIPNRTGFGIGVSTMIAAFKRDGRTPPKHVDGHNGADCITVGDWLKVWMEKADNKDVDESKLRERVKKQRDGVVEFLLKENLIEKKGEWIWRTKRRIQGIDRPWRETHPRTETSPANAEPVNNDLFDDADIPFT